ncbi:MAG: hypothetical protein EOP08_16455 [Proteobacteria bacterium]|nr:MAG: hypothetical protein EOP08_16455 [Pseudomonadota bacterium]
MPRRTGRQRLKRADPRSPLDELKGGNGYLNVVSDLGVLSRMLRARWDAVQGRTAVQESELAEAQQLVETITVAHATRARASDEKSAAGSDRQRAYTLLVMAYEEARRATRWLRHYEDDVDTYLPSLWSGRSAKRNGAVVVAPVDTPVDDAPIVPDGDQPIVPLGDSPVVPLHG